jgi:hypothetical protein
VVGLVLADLYDNFPIPIDLRGIYYAQKAGLVPENDDINLDTHIPASAAIEWLIAEGFVRSGSENPEGVFAPYCVLSQKGLQLLSIPDALKEQQSLGAKISEAAKTTSLGGLKEIAKTVICEGTKLMLQASIQSVMKP